MYNLHHQILCPFSKKIRFLLGQKDIEFNLIRENVWERRKEFISMNTMGTIPILFDMNEQNTICGSSVIVEYLQEKHANGINYIGDSINQKAEARRLQLWFDEKFYNEVSQYILNERFFNRFLKTPTAPNPNNLRLAQHNLNIHLNYIEFLLENRRYLAGDQISIADFAAAGHISSLDYFGDIEWYGRQTAKQWYALIKSQRGFSEILKDRIAGINPSDQYQKLDF
jgi:glutathione S-transferase